MQIEQLNREIQAQMIGCAVSGGEMMAPHVIRAQFDKLLASPPDPADRDRHDFRSAYAMD